MPPRSKNNAAYGIGIRVRGLIERADGSKLERARERLAAARAAKKTTEPEQETEPEEG